MDTYIQNNGSKTDASSVSKQESAAWPYPWFQDEAYQSRGSVSGRLILSDGRPASHAAVFLGDVLPSNKTSLDMGSWYYYTAYTDVKGYFSIPNVRTGSYGLQAWSNGSSVMRDVTTTFTIDEVQVKRGEDTSLGQNLNWPVSTRKKVFQVGDFDHYAYGFKHGGAPWQHGLSAECPANLTWTVGSSETEDWCFAQVHKGNWTIRFKVDEKKKRHRSAVIKERKLKLIVSLAGYSAGASSTVWVNDVVVGNLTSGVAATPATFGLLSDPSLYRSATAAGEWRYFEFELGKEALRKDKKSWNEVRFEVINSDGTWRGFMWDSVILEW